MIAYHFTKKDFNELDPAHSRTFGLHFGSKQQAEKRAERLGSPGRIIRADIRIDNPLYMDDKSFATPVTVMAQMLNSRYTKNASGGLKKALKSLDIRPIDGEPLDKWRFRGFTALRQAVLSAGYDGVIYNNLAEHEGAGKSFIILDSSRITILDQQPYSPQTACKED